MTDIQTADPTAEFQIALKSARLASPVINTQGGRQKLIMPEGFVMADVSDPDARKAFATQKITLDDRESATAYINRFSSNDTVIIANYDTGQIGAVMDWHPDNSDTYPPAGRCAHTATLALRQSEEFKRWDAFEGKLHPQADFAAFLEENAVDIAMPEAAVMIEISRDLEATTEQKFGGRVRLENGDMRFTFETETRTPTTVIIPTEIHLNIPLYQGEAPEILRAAFRYRATQEGLKMAIQWRRVEYQRQAHFTAIATQIAEDTGRPVFFGRGTY